MLGVTPQWTSIPSREKIASHADVLRLVMHSRRRNNNFVVISRYRNCDKLQPDKPLGLNGDLTFFTLSDGFKNTLASDMFNEQLQKISIPTARKIIENSKGKGLGSQNLSQKMFI